MAYGIVKVDNITFDNGGSDQNVTVSGLYRATTSGVTVSGTIAAGTVSGVTVIGSTTVSGATVTGTTANFTSGNFSNLISTAATMSGALIMANQQQVRFREAVGNGVNHIALQAPAIVSADQTITLPDETGTVVTTGDNGSVTSTMILDGTIVNDDISASAAIADTKLATISTAGKVSGSAITSGNIDTSGNLSITNAAPNVRLIESDGASTHKQSLIVRDNSGFNIQCRDEAGTFIANDYTIPFDASGATDHIWRIANTEKARLNSTGLTVVNDLTISDKIIHAGDTNTAIRFPAADTVTVETIGAERMRIDSGGRVGINTAPDGIGFAQIRVGDFTSSLAPNGYFLTGSTGALASNPGWIGGLTLESDAGGTSSVSLVAPNSTTAGAQTYQKAFESAGTGASQRSIIYAGGAERMRVDSSGRLLVGTSTNSALSTLVLQGNSTSSVGAPFLFLQRGVSVPGANDSLGVLAFGNNASNLGAQIFASRDGGTWTSGASHPGRLVFSTTADGSASPTERMRIDRSGNVLVGTTTLISPATTTDEGSRISPNIIAVSRSSQPPLFLQRTTDNGAIAVFYRQTTDVGSISVTTTATAYNTSSDYRLKENVVPLDGAITRLNQLPVHRFNFIADPDTVVDGFIAHEAAAVVPECVTGEKDEVDENGTPIYQGIDQSKIVPLLTAALQEAIAKIDALEARITALEA